MRDQQEVGEKKGNHKATGKGHENGKEKKSIAGHNFCWENPLGEGVPRASSNKGGKPFPQTKRNRHPKKAEMVKGETSTAAKARGRGGRGTCLCVICKKKPLTGKRPEGGGGGGLWPGKISTKSLSWNCQGMHLQKRVRQARRVGVRG